MDWAKVDRARLVQRRQRQLEDELFASTPTPQARTAKKRSQERVLYDWVRSYNGSSRFVRSMRAELAKPGLRYLTPKQLEVVRRIIREEQRAA